VFRSLPIGGGPFDVLVAEATAGAGVLCEVEIDIAEVSSRKRRKFAGSEVAAYKAQNKRMDLVGSRAHKVAFHSGGRMGSLSWFSSAKRTSVPT